MAHGDCHATPRAGRKAKRDREDAVIVAFDRSSAAIAGMLAPNLTVRVVVVLGREHFGDPYEKYAALNGREIAVRGKVLFVSISVDSADAVVRKLFIFCECRYYRRTPNST